MKDCDRLLQQLSNYLDGHSDGIDLIALRRQAEADVDCLALFESMLEAHALFSAAPMVNSSRDVSQSVTTVLRRQQRRERLALLLVLSLGALTAFIPIALLIWAGMAFWIDPNIMSPMIHSVVAFLSQTTTLIIALLSAIQHLPPWAIMSLFTLFSLSFLLMALALANQRQPELFFSPHHA